MLQLVICLWWSSFLRITFPCQWFMVFAWHDDCSYKSLPLQVTMSESRVWPSVKTREGGSKSDNSDGRQLKRITRPGSEFDFEGKSQFSQQRLQGETYGSPEELKRVSTPLAVNLGINRELTTAATLKRVVVLVEEVCMSNKKQCDIVGYANDRRFSAVIQPYVSRSVMSLCMIAYRIAYEHACCLHSCSASHLSQSGALVSHSTSEIIMSTHLAINTRDFREIALHVI